MVRGMFRYARYPLLAFLGLALNALQDYPNSSLNHIHITLAEFLSRGQLVIELLPPLSYLIAQHIHGYYLLTIDLGSLLCCATLMFSTILTGWTTKARLWLLVQFAVLYSGISVILPLQRQDSILLLNSWTALGTANNISTTLLLYCIYIETYILGSKTSLQYFTILSGVSDFLCIIAGLLGYNTVEFYLCIFVVSVFRVYKVLDITKEASTSMWKACSTAILAIFRTTAISICVVVLSFPIIYPQSELNFGGNYNLHYLSPQYRQTLRRDRSYFPQSNPTNLQCIESMYLTGEAILLNRPYSLFLPRAGFLWTDNYVWEPVDWNFVDISAHTKFEEMTGLGRRVIMSDRLNTVGLWTFLDLGFDNTSTDQSRIQGVCNSKQFILLRDTYTGNYLSVDHDIAPHLSPEEEDKDYERFATSVMSTPTKDSIWQITYDSDRNYSLRLRNKFSECYLATSFRTYSTIESIYTNDSITRQVYLEIETTCSRSPTLAASTFFIVDGLSESNTSISRNSHLMNTLLAGYNHILEILTAMYNLRAFRHRYPSIQYAPIEHADIAPASPYAAKLASYSAVAAVVLVFTRTAYLKRYSILKSHGCEEKMLRFQYKAKMVVLVIDLVIQSIHRKHATRFTVCITLWTLRDLIQESTVKSK